MSEIRTERLLLRRARMTDLPAIHAILGNVRATRYWSTPPHATLDQSRDWLRSMVDAPDDASDDYVVELEGAVIGKAGSWRLPEVGFIFHPEYWGRGFAREALAAAIGRIFENHPVNALEADVDPRNAAALGLLERLGFRETGRARGSWQVGEELCDSVYLSLPRQPASEGLYP